MEKDFLIFQKTGFTGSCEAIDAGCKAYVGRRLQVYLFADRLHLAARRLLITRARQKSYSRISFVLPWQISDREQQPFDVFNIVHLQILRSSLGAGLR